MKRFSKLLSLLFGLALAIAGGFMVSNHFSSKSEAAESNNSGKELSVYEEEMADLEKQIALKKKIKKSGKLEEYIILEKKDISVVQDEDGNYQYIVTVGWEFPEGSELYEKDPSLESVYVPIISKKHQLYTWSYDEDWLHFEEYKDIINASKKSGEVELVFPNEEEMLKDIDKYLSIDYWADAIAERKIALEYHIKEEKEKKKIEADIKKYNVQNDDF